MNFGSSYTQGGTSYGRRRRKQRLFSLDIEQLLYALGDGPYSVELTVNALEETLVMYLGDLCHATLEYAKRQGRNRVKIEDFPFVLRNDPYKLARLDYIINQSQKIEKARKMFDTKNVVPDLSQLQDQDLSGPKPRKKRRKNASKQAQNESSDNEK